MKCIKFFIQLNLLHSISTNCTLIEVWPVIGCILRYFCVILGPYVLGQVYIVEDHDQVQRGVPTRRREARLRGLRVGRRSCGRVRIPE